MPAILITLAPLQGAHVFRNLFTEVSLANSLNLRLTLFYPSGMIGGDSFPLESVTKTGTLAAAILESGPGNASYPCPRQSENRFNVRVVVPSIFSPVSIHSVGGCA
jgi:hypothetical protein